MSLSIQQHADYLGKDRWHWAVWLDGSSEELNGIDHVRYILHSTFPNPVRDVSDRSSNFRLETSGWGTFRLYAKAVHKDGHETSLEHDMVLLYPDGRPTFA